MDGQDVNDNSKNETAVGQKRKWGDVAPRGGQGRRSSKGMNKKSKTGMGDDAQVDGREAFADGDAASDESEESDYEPEETVPEGPLKAVFKEETIRLNLRVAYVDFAGLFEKRDLQMLIPLIRPRKLILVAGEAKETLSLAEDCKALMESGEDDTINIFAPSIGESVDASVDTNAWSLKLSQDLLKRLAWQNVKGLSVVAVTGRLDTIRAAMAGGDEADESRRKKLKMIKGDEETDIKTSNLPTATESESEPVLDVLPTYAPASNQLVTQPIHVGDLRLADLRRLMQASGHRADFRGEGTLVIDDAVVVRKSASGRIEVEGGGYMMPGARAQHYEGTFFAVKRKIYEGLAVVAGG